MLLESLQLNIVEFTFVVFSVLLAYSLKGVTGFGAGLVAIPLLVLLLPLHVCVPAISLLSYGGNITQSITLRRDANWRELWPMIPFSLLGVVVAIWLLANINPHWLTLSLGLFILMYALSDFLSMPTIRGSRLWAIPIGGFGGFIGALFGSGGFIYVVYLKLRNLDKSQFRASVATILLFDGTFRMAGYTGAGLLTERSLLLAFVLLPVMLVALYLGNILQQYIANNRFQRLISLMLIACSFLLAYKSLKQLL